MKQMIFAEAEYAGKCKQASKERFLTKPHYPKCEGARPAFPPMAVLRIKIKIVKLSGRLLYVRAAAKS